MVNKLSDISIKKPFDDWPLYAILLSVTILSTLVLYPKLIIVHTPYQIGDIADRDIKAPTDLLIEDKGATRERIEKARNEVSTIYDYNRSMLPNMVRQVNKAFGLARTALESGRKEVSADGEEKNSKLWQVKPEFEKALGISVSNGAFRILENENFSKEISELIINIVSPILANGVVANKELLLKENDKGIILKTVGTDDEKIETNLKHFYGLDQAKTMVRIVGEPLLKGLDYTVVNLIVDFTQRLLQPNITLNRSETEKRKTLAAADIKPILYQIKKGEMILREGERVTPLHMLKLKALRDQTGSRQVLEKGIGTAFIIFSLLVITYLIHLKFQSKILFYQNKNLIFISSLIILSLLILQLWLSLAQSLAPESPVSISPESIYFSIPLAAGTMTMCQFLGFSIAFPFSIVIALITAIAFENSYAWCLFFLLNGIMGAYWIQNCKERKGFIQAGVRLGLLNIALAAMVDVYMVNVFSGFKILWDGIFAFSGGILAGILTAGINPVMEMCFGFTTASTLQELSNLDQPLLRRLMLEAPGTYHHAMIVGSMVEAAASEISADPLLGKVCGYYHDIGKLKNPLYFIENQKDGKNIHNKLAPSMSCLILISHIKNGVELAREKKLGRDITDAIQQHHGTTLISFFYEKAKKQKKDQAVNIDNFRYPGPKPQTRETALVMLADVVEAASRSLENPTPSRIQGLVQSLINKLFSDNQLDECPLTLKDLHKIARSFNKILSGIYHHRIEYPDKYAPGEPREQNGHSDRQPAEAVPESTVSDTEDSPSTLKRLGQN